MPATYFDFRFLANGDPESVSFSGGELAIEPTNHEPNRYCQAEKGDAPDAKHFQHSAQSWRFVISGLGARGKGPAPLTTGRCKALCKFTRLLEGPGSISLQ